MRTAQLTSSQKYFFTVCANSSGGSATMSSHNNLGMYQESMFRYNGLTLARLLWEDIVADTPEELAETVRKYF